MGRHIGTGLSTVPPQKAQKLFLKGTRCDSAQVRPSIVATAYRAVIISFIAARPASTPFWLRGETEGQSVITSGIYERQFRKYYEEASRRPGNTGDALMSLLERRLDNVVTRLGFAASRVPQARQMITHGAHHRQRTEAFDIPSYLIRPGDRIQVKNREHSRKLAADNLATGSAPPVPEWLDRVNADPPETRTRLPAATMCSASARDTSVDH